MSVHSMIACLIVNLSSEHGVAPNGVAQNDRDNEQSTYKHKTLALRGGCGIPDRRQRWDDVRPQADAEAAVTQKDRNRPASTLS